MAQEKIKKNPSGRKKKDEALPDPAVLWAGAWSLIRAITAFEVHTKRGTECPEKLLAPLRTFRTDILEKQYLAAHDSDMRLQVKLLTIAMLKGPLYEIYKKVRDEALNRSACRKMVKPLVAQWAHGIQVASSLQSPLDAVTMTEDLCISGDNTTDDDSYHRIESPSLEGTVLAKLHTAFGLVQPRSIGNVFSATEYVLWGASEGVLLETPLRRLLQSSRPMVYSEEAIDKAVSILKSAGRLSLGLGCAISSDRSHPISLMGAT